MTRKAWIKMLRSVGSQASRRDGRDRELLYAHEVAMNRWDSKPLRLLRVLRYFDWLNTEEWIAAAGGATYECGRTEYNAWEQAVLRLRKAGLVDVRRPRKWKFEHRANDRTLDAVNKALAATRIYHERIAHQFSDDKLTRRAA